jgi:hypothetical protein
MNSLEHGNLSPTSFSACDFVPEKSIQVNIIRLFNDLLDRKTSKGAPRRQFPAGALA